MDESEQPPPPPPRNRHERRKAKVIATRGARADGKKPTGKWHTYAPKAKPTEKEVLATFAKQVTASRQAQGVVRVIDEMEHRYMSLDKEGRLSLAGVVKREHLEIGPVANTNHDSDPYAGYDFAAARVELNEEGRISVDGVKLVPPGEKPKLTKEGFTQALADELEKAVRDGAIPCDDCGALVEMFEKDGKMLAGCSARCYDRPLAERKTAFPLRPYQVRAIEDGKNYGR